MYRALLPLLLACSNPPAPAAPKIEPADLRDERFVATIAKAASNYRSWGRVDEAPNIAPELCRMPMREDYGMASHVRQSKAPEGTHGTKLYYLWASQPGYGTKPASLKDGFTIVKESFAATTKPRARNLTGESLDLRNPGPVGWLETPRGTLYAGEAVGLYVMTKVGAGPGTDDGWIYGTLGPSGEVTSAGRVESCMECHDSAPHGRLFGLQPTKQLVELAPPGTPSWQDRGLTR